MRYIALTFNLLIFILFPSCSSLNNSSYKQDIYLFKKRYNERITAHFEVLKPKEDKIEVYWTKPKEIEGKVPLIIYVHGHLRKRNGGDFFFHKHPMLKKVSSKYKAVSVSISQPGYGLSSGPPDYCGPKTQNAVIEVIKSFKKRSFVDSSKIIILGESRGAVVASILAGKYDFFKGIFLLGNFYDLSNFYHNYGEYYKGSEKVYNRIKSKIDRESGLTKQNIKNRSPIFYSKNIKAIVWDIHGEKDEFDPNYAKRFIENAKKNNPESKLIIVPKQPHGIKYEIIDKYFYSFLDELKVPKN